MGWITQPYYEKGLAEGEAKGEAIGEARGEARGEAKIFVRVLEKRFGPIPTPLRDRIFGANVESIEAWVEQAFDAPTSTPFSPRTNDTHRGAALTRYTG